MNERSYVMMEERGEHEFEGSRESIDFSSLPPSNSTTESHTPHFIPFIRRRGHELLERTKPKFVLISSGLGKWKKVRSPLKESHPQSIPVEKVIRSHSRENFERPGRITRWLARLPSHYYFTTLYLLLVGVIAAFCGACIDVWTAWSIKAHFWLLTVTNITYIKYILWTAFTLVTTFLSIWLTDIISPAAAGSGIPELKTILSGVDLPAALSLRTLVAKMLGLSLSIASGLSIGKVGPSVHLATLIANNVASLALFQRIKKSKLILRQMLGAACAIGYATSIGAPIGGVLLSVEITAAYYPVKNYWFSYVGAIAGGVTFRYFRNWGLGNPGLSSIILPNFGDLQTDIGIIEVLVFTSLGVLCGFLGVAFTQVNKFTIKGWRALCKKYPKINTPYLFAGFIVLITSTLTFPYFIGDFMAIPGWWELQDVLNVNMSDESDLLAKDWNKYPLILSLLILFSVKYCLTAISIGIPLPAGLFAPVLSAGGSLGRIFGEATVLIFHNTRLFAGVNIVPGGYAIVGASALVGATTYTLSPAIIMLEITGQLQFLLPLLISTTTAVAVARRFSALSVYDSMTKLKGLPWMPPLQLLSYELLTRDFMTRNVKFLTKDFQLQSVIDILTTADYSEFAVVDSAESMHLLGTVHRDTLEQSLYNYNKRKLATRSATATPTISREQSSAVAPAVELPVTNLKAESTTSTATPQHDTPLVPLEDIPVTNLDAATSTATPLNDTPLVPLEDIDTPTVPLEQHTDSPTLQTTLQKVPSTSSAPRGTTPIGLASTIPTRGGTPAQLPSLQALFATPTGETDTSVRLPVQFRSAPIQLLDDTPLDQVHMLFTTLCLRQGYVTSRGVLVGVVTRSDLKAAIAKKERDSRVSIIVEE